MPGVVLAVVAGKAVSGCQTLASAATTAATAAAGAVAVAIGRGRQGLLWLAHCGADDTVPLLTFIEQGRCALVPAKSHETSP